MQKTSVSDPDDRLFADHIRAREREAATREILDLISQSREDAGPVFDAILHRAASLCDAFAAALILSKPGEAHQRMAAHYGVDQATVALYDRGEVSMNPDASFAARAITTGKVVHVEDMMDTEFYRQGIGLYVSIVRDSGIRTEMQVPLLTPSGGIGAFVIFRREVRPYTRDEIAIVETFAAQAVIAIENVRQFRELQTRLAREAASAEILQVISQSRDDDRPVFDVVLRKAADLCNASLASLLITSEDRSHAVLVADRGLGQVSGLIQVGTTVWPMESGYAPSTCMREGRIVHIHDIADTDLYRSGDPLRVAAVEEDGIRTCLAVPMFSGGQTVGCILVYRREVNPFKADEIALVETFAAQAVIAIENVRQFRELQTRLAREAATREILEVISQSRDDDAPVFDAVLRNANRLCGTSMAYLALGRPDDTHMTLAAYVNPYLPSEDSVDKIIAFANQSGMRMDAAEHFSARAIISGEVVQIADIATSQGYLSGEPTVRILVEDVGVRTVLSVPMFDAQGAIGAISLQRREERPFADDEIALIQSFAAQAVIAIENARQFRELQTRLEREAATREILTVISRSRDDDAPVFDVIVRNAARLCNAPMAWLMLAVPAPRTFMIAGYHGLSRRQIELGDLFELDAEPDAITGVGRAIFEAQTNQDEDLAQTTHYLNDIGDMRMLVDDEGIRTRLCVPLISGGVGIGAILLTRREVAPFTTDQIALVETFAAQAVIAIENVRQFRELQSSLEQQEATSDILRVISQSREDETQVFDLILEKAAVLCNADQSSLQIVNEARTHVRHMADWGHDRTAYHPGLEYSLDLPLSIVPTIRTAKVAHIEDYSQSDAYKDRFPIAVGLVETEGVRTRLIVPLLQNGIAIGCISLSRRAVRPFNPDEIALVETFAAQAVIAIENVRQFRELQTRLEREAATRDILEVISQSRDDDVPVFDMIAQSAARLCGAAVCTFWRVEDGLIQYCASHGLDSAATQDARLTVNTPLLDNTLTGQVVKTRSVTRIEDATDESYLDYDWAQAQSLKQMVGVPIFVGGDVWGCICLAWPADRSPTDADIQLVEGFAAQASIAIENVRQFRALQERLEREAATRDILEVISQSRDDDVPVFDMIAQSAARLCGAAICTFWRVEDGLINYCASYGLDSAASASAHSASGTPLLDNTLTAQVFKGRAVARIEDATAESYHDHEWARALGLKQLVGVPIFVGDDVWGSINLMWPVDRAPREADIQLVESFAAQASIAIENVRQFRALQERLEREAATRNVLRVISESPDDEQPTFEAILDSATRLCGTPYASLVLGRKGDTSQRMVAHRESAPETLAVYRDGSVRMDPEDSIGARAILEGRTIHVPDMADTDQYRAGHERFRLVVDRQGLRTNLFEPLLGPDGGIGCFILWKKEVAPFTADQIALMETFASHAVIAIENVRQFKALEALNAELGERVHEQVGEIERMGRLKRFLPAAVADAVVTSGSEKMLSSHRALLGVLFCDIRGFTAFCETAEPEETIEVLQTYHEEMGKLINTHSAGVDHRMGDGIMVLFNDPLPCDDPAGDAVRLAMAMRARMAELCRGWKRMGYKLGFGLGASLGYATVGMVGFEGRFDYTASGTAINLASRLCDEAQDGEILISPRVRLAVEDDFTVESRGEISFKGIREPVEVFCVTGIVG